MQKELVGLLHNKPSLLLNHYQLQTVLNPEAGPCTKTLVAHSQYFPIGAFRLKEYREHPQLSLPSPLSQSTPGPFPLK